MNKDEILAAVRILSLNRQLTRDELVAAFEQGQPEDAISKKLGLANVMYYIGGGIVFLGISIFVWQNWNALGFATRLLATLGAAVAAYFLGVVLGRENRYEGVSSAFYLISGLVFPVGLYVLFENAGVTFGDGTYSVIGGLLMLIYGCSFVLMRKTVLALFTILFGTGFFFVFTNYLVGQNPYFDLWSFSEYRALLIGLAYLLLGSALARGKYTALSGFLYGFGALGFLGSALTLSGWSPNQNVFWELLYPLLVFGALFVSVYLKSRALLVFGTIFLMAYIFKVTGEYFTQGLGWPLALVVAGLLMIAVGYVSIELNKKYIRA